MSLHFPENITVLEPSVGENAVQATEDVGQVSHAGAGLRAQGQAAGEVFRGGEGVGSPVKGMAAVVDSAA